MEELINLINNTNVIYSDEEVTIKLTENDADKSVFEVKMYFINSFKKVKMIYLKNTGEITLDNSICGVIYYYSKISLNKDFLPIELTREIKIPKNFLNKIGYKYIFVATRYDNNDFVEIAIGTSNIKNPELKPIRYIKVDKFDSMSCCIACKSILYAKNFYNGGKI